MPNHINIDRTISMIDMIENAATIFNMPTIFCGVFIGIVDDLSTHLFENEIYETKKKEKKENINIDIRK